MEQDLKNEIVQAAVEVQCFENFDSVALSKNSVAFPIADIASLGAGLSSVVPMFRTISQTVETAGSNNLYRCVFPNGVTGQLAKFAHENANLGTIMNNGNIVGQARWIKADSVPSTITTQVPFNPATMFMAVALMNLNRKLDSISNTQNMLVESIEQERKSQLLADLQILLETADEYKYYWNNDNHLTASITQVKTINRNAKKERISYQEKIEKTLNKKEFEKLGASISARIEKVANSLIHYKLAMYNEAYSSYMQIMLTKNFNAELLQKISNEIEDDAYQYKLLYTKCYSFIESVMSTSVEKYLVKGISKFTKVIGQTVSKMPKLNQTQLDEFLLDASGKIEQKEVQKIADTMQLFIRHKESGVKLFSDNIQTLNRLYNQPFELVFDKQNVYLLNGI